MLSVSLSHPYGTQCEINIFIFEMIFKQLVDGEQTYCRKWILDKTPKIVLGHNGEKIFSKY